MVIGGLIFDVKNKDQSKVPYICDIPVIGNFFRFSSDRNRKTNLLIFLTPHIIRNERDQRNLSVAEREDKMRKPFEERGMRAPHWEQLYRPSWEVRPSLEPEAEATPEAGCRGAAPKERPKPLREEPLAQAPAAAGRRHAPAPRMPAANQLRAAGDPLGVRHATRQPHHQQRSVGVGRARELSPGGLLPDGPDAIASAATTTLLIMSVWMSSRRRRRPLPPTPREST